MSKFMASRERLRAESMDNATKMAPLSRPNVARCHLADIIQDNDFRPDFPSCPGTGPWRPDGRLQHILLIVSELHEITPLLKRGVTSCKLLFFSRVDFSKKRRPPCAVSLSKNRRPPCAVSLRKRGRQELPVPQIPACRIERSPRSNRQIC